jgi:hypothetical protein
MRMIPAGYWGIRDSKISNWTSDPRVERIWSVSSCINGCERDWVNQWMHNGYWHFNSLEDLRRAFTGCGVVDDYVPVYYEILEKAFDENISQWIDLWIESSFNTDVQDPPIKEFLGFDFVSFYVRNNPECSPFSCNGLSREVDINSFCLCTWDIDRMIEYVSRIKLNDTEPGPYKIYAVYRLPETPIISSKVGTIGKRP